MNNKTIAIIIVISAVAGGAITRYYMPKTVTVEHETTKTVTVTHTEEKTLPDGTKVVDSTTTENQSKQDSKTTQSSPDNKKWLVMLGAGTGVNLQPFYQIQVNRRLLGPLFVGVNASTDSRIGISLGVEF